MHAPLSLSTLLPPVHLDRPEASWIHTTSVEGPFGITASVRNFDEVQDWQEHTRNLTQGYYRLIHPPRLQQLKARIEAMYPGWNAVLFTSGGLAEKETRDLLAVENDSQPVENHRNLPDTLRPDALHILHLEQGGLTAGITLLQDAERATVLHERNRRRGGSLSARTVAHLLDEPDAEPFIPEDETVCIDQLRTLEPAQHALLYPSGMAAVTAALEEALTPETPRMLVLGNVYRDTHLLLEEQSWAGRSVTCDFLDTGDLDGLAARIGDADVAGVFVETITNPLIEIPDLPAIAALCRSHGKALLVDSTMASPLNAHPLDLGATMVIHSTSKYLSGHNTHGGGVILTNDPDGFDRLLASQRQWDNRLSPAEVTALREGLETFSERMPRFNANGHALAERLRNHPAVETVYYGNQGCPDWLSGLGSVVSCELREPSLEKVAAFFNHPLPGVLKAPSLGSDHTLFCPYVLLAYYDKTDAYLRDCNLSKTLFRFAAGCETDFSPVLNSITSALDGLPTRRSV